MYDLLIFIEDELSLAQSVWASPDDLLKLSTFVQQDILPRPLEVAYLFGNTPELEHSILERARALVEDGQADLLAVTAGREIRTDPDGHIIYRGGQAWKRDLIEAGIDERKIVVVPAPDPQTHTGSEAKRFIGMIQDSGLSAVSVVAHPTHVLRAFVSTVTEVVRRQLDIKVYAIPGLAEDWQSTTLYSQHGERRKRIDCLEGELQRLNRWHAKGDLISAAEVLNYLETRED